MSIRATHSYADRGDLAGDLAWMIANQLMSAVEENGEVESLLAAVEPPSCYSAC